MIKQIDEIIKDVIRDVPNFPIEGVDFKDITPIFRDPIVSKKIIAHLADKLRNEKIDIVAGIESRGFLFGFSLALELNVPFVLIRKKGKLPPETISIKYDLEYGTSEIEILKDSIGENQRVHIHDDVLATGGTARAAGDLIKKAGGEIQGYSFLVELSFLNGIKNLTNISTNIITLQRY